MDYEKRYNETLERARKEWVENLDNCYTNYRERLEIIFPELKESEDERIKKKLICFVENWEKYNPNSPFDDYALYTSDRDECDKILAWLEKQGEQKPVISEDALREGIAHFGITQYQIDNWLKKYVDVEKQGKKLDPDKVIAWLVANICDFEYYVKRFKQDFGL